ncbi:hypothetical protein AX17_000316 [Amanita inopinata Kibby_2008]|nr:hypothetical protein AX17_000316 [Amanita inopinata Kibby_2008]
MQLGSKDESEASFSFQINDAVKGDEEYLLAEDDFLRDVNDYTLTTPAPPSRTLSLDRNQPLTLSQLTPRPNDHDADTSSVLPKPFAPSSPTRSNVPRREAAATKRLRPPKRPVPLTSKPSKSSIPQSASRTRPSLKWPSPSRQNCLPRPEASPVVARLTSLRAEIDMLGESDGLSHTSLEQQVDEPISNKRTEFESENRSPLNSNMPTPTKLGDFVPTQQEVFIENDELPPETHLVTQSIPTHGSSILNSPIPCDDKNGNDPVNPDVSMNVEAEDGAAEPYVMASQKLIGPTNSDNPVASPSEAEDYPGRDHSPVVEEITSSSTGNHEASDPSQPLTLSQLSPRKRSSAAINSENHGSISPCASVATPALMSPMRFAHKRPLSAVASDDHDQRSKKGKTALQATRNQVTTAKKSDARIPSRTTRNRNTRANANVRNQGRMIKHPVSSSSGSKLASSGISSSSSTGASTSAGASALVSSRSQSQSQRTVGGGVGIGRGSGASVTRVRGILRQSQKRAHDMRREQRNAVEKVAVGGSTSNLGGGLPLSSSGSKSGPLLSSSSSPVHEKLGEESVTESSTSGSTSLVGSGSASGKKNADAGQAKQTPVESVAGHLIATKSVGFRFQFRPEEEGEARQAERDGTTLMTSSSNTQSISRSISGSQFKYLHHRPIPDYKAQHAILEASLSQRKENIAPVVPFQFELYTDVRAKERERFDASVKEKEREMEKGREVKRREREEQEEREMREMRRKAVPKANAVPEWYKDAPRRSRRRKAEGGPE